MRILACLTALAILFTSAAAAPARAQGAGIPEAQFQELTAKAGSVFNRYERDRFLTTALARTDLSTEQRIKLLWERGSNRSNGTQDTKRAVEDYQAALALKPANPENAARLKELADFAQGQLSASEARVADAAAAADFTQRFSDLIAVGRLDDAARWLRSTYASNKQARDSRMGFRALHYQRLVDSGHLCRSNVAVADGVVWKQSGRDQHARWCTPTGN